MAERQNPFFEKYMNISSHPVISNHEAAVDSLGRRTGVKLIVYVCALLVSGLGLIALLGWVFGLSVLTSFGVGKIPMAPSTALLFTLYGITIILRMRWPQRGTHWVVLFVHVIGTLVALILASLNYGGIYPQVEHLGFSILQDMSSTVPQGHMSPLTALCFVLSSFAFLLSFSISFAKHWRIRTAWLLNMLILGISFVLALAYLLKMPLFYGSSIIPPALPTSMAFMAMGTALLTLTWPTFRKTELPKYYSRILVGVFVTLTVSILCASVLAYRAYAKYYLTQVESQLSTIATLKVAELQQWRNERFGDAKIIYNNTVFFELARHYFRISSKGQQGQKSSKDEEAQKLIDWLKRYPEQYDYDQIRLLDPKGVTHMSFPLKLPPISAAVLKYIPEVTQTKRIMMVDFYRHDYNHRIYLSLLIPIVNTSVTNQAIGVVVLRINPEKYLYPFIVHWPTPSETAEVLLVRRDGNDVLFLNELKFKENAALNFRLPLNRVDVPAVMAVLGRTGIYEGVDYRNKPTIADLHKVPNSPWFLVTRMSTSEVYSPMKHYLWMIIGIIVTLTFGAGSVLTYMWWKQNLDFYQERILAAEALKQSYDLLGEAQKISKLGGWAYEVITGQITWTDEVYRIHGVEKDYDPNDLSKDISFYMPEDRETISIALKRAIKFGEPYDLELGLIRLNGERIWVRTIGKPITENGQVVRVTGNIMDITALKQIEIDLLAAKTAAEAAAKSKAQFLDIAAHELRTPITAFSLLLQLAQKQLEKGQQPDARLLARLRAPVDRITHLVADLLDVSRLERGLVVLRPALTNMVTLISGCMEEFQMQTPKRRLIFTEPKQPIEINVDSVRINQVLSNLLDNAVKYTPEDSPIEVSLDLAPTVLRVSVTDHGPGIPKQQQEKLFDAFARGNTDATIRASGLGLGLSVCRGLIEMHGGTIGVLSEEGCGSTFYFELPR